MVVVAFLATSRRTHVSKMLDGLCRLVIASDVAELRSLIDSSRPDALLVDPDGDAVRTERADYSGVLVDAVKAWPSVPVVVFARFDRRAMRLAAPLVRDREIRLVERDAPDSALILRSSLEELTRLTPGAVVLRSLGPELDLCDPWLRNAINRLFTESIPPRLAVDLAVMAQCSRSSLYRRLEAAGLPWPERLISAAGVLSVYARLRHAREPLRLAAVRLGFASADQVRLMVRRVAACRPSELAELAPIEVARRALEWLRACNGGRQEHGTP